MWKVLECVQDILAIIWYLHSEKPHTCTQDSTSFFQELWCQEIATHTHTHSHTLTHTHTHTHTHQKLTHSAVLYFESFGVSTALTCPTTQPQFLLLPRPCLVHSILLSRICSFSPCCEIDPFLSTCITLNIETGSFLRSVVLVPFILVCQPKKLFNLVKPSGYFTYHSV